jgi:hypothetical protein
MMRRPRKRQLANGKTVWVARFKDERGRVRIARPTAVAGRSSSSETHRERSMKPHSSAFPSARQASVATSTCGCRLIRGRNAPIGRTPAGFAKC